MSTTLLVRSEIARKAPDPNYANLTHWWLWVKASDLPLGIPSPNNSRVPKDNLRAHGVYRVMSDELMDSEEPQIFHLKNKGITLTADYVREVKRKDSTVYNLVLSEEDGIIDGGHTYKAITEALENELIDEDNEQYVQLRVIIGMEPEWIPEVSEGQNSTVQVKDVSMLNQRHAFDWLKDLLANQPYFDKIAWQENPEEGQVVNVTDIVRYLYVIHPAFTNPKLGYANASKVLEHYEENLDEYYRLRDVVDDVLRLTDYMSWTARTLWINGTKRRFTANSFAGEKYRAKDRFWFIDEAPKRDSAGNRPVLHSGAVFPMLHAFSQLLTEVPAGHFEWRKRVKAKGAVNPQAVWDTLGYKFMDELAIIAGTGESAMPVTTLGKNPASYRNLELAMKLAIADREI